jgi:phosphonoacetaldehyde hydrolase
MLKPLRAVLFDWAGTAVDFGCQAPTAVLLEAFEEFGIPLTSQEARGPMGLKKIDHVRKLFEIPRVTIAFAALQGRAWNEEDVEALYSKLEPTLESIVRDHCGLIPGHVECVDVLRNQGLKIGSTTGYTRLMMERFVEDVAAQGYAPDFWMTPSDVSQGRPSPEMLFENLRLLEIAKEDAFLCVKVGDTPSDMQEGRAAGMWCIGYTRCGNEMGLTLEEEKSLNAEERQQRVAEIQEKLVSAGAHLVVEGPWELLSAIEKIAKRVNQGEKP